jgi:hypothetical protein
MKFYCAIVGIQRLSGNTKTADKLERTDTSIWEAEKHILMII